MVTSLRSGILVVCGLVGWWTLAVSPARAETDFYRNVYPILKTNCISCHNKTTTESGLNLESPESIRKGGDTGPGVVPGKSGESLIYQAARQDGDYVMPPEDNKTGAKKLTAKEMAVLAAWIDEGAKSSVRQAEKVAWQSLPTRVQPIYSVALTKEGRWAACGRGNQLFVYDLATRKLAAVLADKQLPAGKNPKQSGIAHHGLVHAIAFSPDGNRLASGSYREVKIWHKNVEAAKQRSAPAIPEIVLSAISPDGKVLVCGDKQGTVHVVDATNGKSIRDIPKAGPTGIKLLNISPDSSTVAVCAADAKLRIWKITTGELLATFAIPQGAKAASWTADGKAFCVAGDDHLLRVWQVPTAPVDAAQKPAAPVELKGATAEVIAITNAANPGRLVAASADGQVRVWQVTEGKLLQTLKIPGTISIDCSEDGQMLAAGCGDGVVRVWDLKTGKSKIDLSGDLSASRKVTELDWKLKFEQLELAYQKQQIARHEAQNKALDGVIKKAHETIEKVEKKRPAKVKLAATAQAEKDQAQKAADAIAKKIADAGKTPPEAALAKQNEDAQKKLAAAVEKLMAAKDEVKQLQHHHDDAAAGSKSAKELKEKNLGLIKEANEKIAATQEDVKQITAELAATKDVSKKPGIKPVSVVFSRDSAKLAAMRENGELCVWAVTSGMPVAEASSDATMTSATLDSIGEGVFVACAQNGASTVLKTTVTWSLEHVLGGEVTGSPFADRVNAVCFSPDGNTLAAGGGEPSRSGDISLWDVETGKLLKTWNERHTDSVLSLDFSTDGRFLASGGADRLARVTEIATGKQVGLYEGHTHHVMDVTFRADGRVLATAGADALVLVWDTVIGEQSRKIKGWAKEVTSLEFVGATTNIVTSSGDKLIRLVREAGSVIRSISGLPTFMQSAAISASGDIIIGGGEDGVLHVWNGTDGKEIVAFPAQ